jgi:hypothetical protein
MLSLQTQPVSIPRIIQPVDLSEKQKLATARTHIGTPAKGDTISVDTPLHEVQRPLHEHSIKKYIDRIGTVDWNMFGHVKVVQYADGSQYIIDGQHRISLVKTLSPKTKQVPAHIIFVDGTETAAQYFAYLNGVMVRKITNEELLWSEVIARDPDALNILRVLQLAGLSCGQVNEGLIQVSRADFEKCLKLGEKETIYAALLIKAGFPTSDNIGLLLHGLTRLLTVKQYSGLMNNLTLGKKFKEWFTTFPRSSGFTYKKMCFKEYQQGQWQNGIAFGILEMFHTYMTMNGFGNHVPALYHIKDLYEKGLK